MNEKQIDMERFDKAARNGLSATQLANLFGISLPRAERLRAEARKSFVETLEPPVDHPEQTEDEQTENDAETEDGEDYSELVVRVDPSNFDRLLAQATQEELVRYIQAADISIKREALERILGYRLSGLLEPAPFVVDKEQEAA